MYVNYTPINLLNRRGLTELKKEIEEKDKIIWETKTKLESPPGKTDLNKNLVRDTEEM